MMSSDHGQDAGKMPVPLFGKTRIAGWRLATESHPCFMS